MLIVLESGNLNLLEPSGPVQACNGIALPLYSMGVNLYINLATPINILNYNIKVLRPLLKEYLVSYFVYCFDKFMSTENI